MREDGFLRILNELVEGEDLVVAFERRQKDGRMVCTVSDDDRFSDDFVGDGRDLGEALAVAYDRVRPKLAEARS